MKHINLNKINIGLNHMVKIMICLLVTLIIKPAFAENFQDIYQLAVANDPVYKQAVAANLATQENKPQAWSQLLPNVSLSAGTSYTETTTSGGFVFGGVPGTSVQEFESDANNYTFSLNQPLFRWDSFLQLKQAAATIEQSNAQLMTAEQDLIIRTADTYFRVLGSMDALTFAQAEKLSLGRQLDQVNQRFEVGLTAITDVQEAKAGYDSAVAAELVAENLVNDTRENLREIIGDYVMELALLKEEFPLVHPDPDSIDEWTNTALEQNLNILAGMYAVESARQTVKIQRAGHLPTLDLQGSKGYSKSTGGRFGANKSKSDSIGLQLSVPIYQGGFVNSRTRQAVHQLDQELERLEQTRRATQRSTRQSFLGVISGISQVEALKQVVLSSETALQAVQAGFEVGTRTAVDVVASERNLTQAKRDYAKARYEYVINTMRLKQAAGILKPEDVANINNLLN